MPCHAYRAARRPGAVKPLAAACAIAWAGLSVVPEAARAQAQAAAPVAATIDLPAQPLERALPALAQQLGTPIAADAALLQGKTAPALQGRFTAQQALQRLLAGTGLEASLQGGAMVVQRAAYPSEPTEAALPEVRVRASADPLPGEPPKPFAGGQVARGARVGILGDRDIFETPFTVTAYTREAIDNQQVRTVAEVLRNDPSINLKQNTNGGGSDDVYNIRGFLSASGASLFDGLPRLTGRSQALEGIERVELLKGPTAFANGSPIFSAGGMVNFVPKRATDAPLTRLTTRYYSDSVFGAHADIGRRFGEDNAFGIRVNTALRDGDAALDEVSKRNQLLNVALDYRGDTLRLFADLEYGKQRTFNYLGGTGIADGVPVPAAPHNTNNWAQAWGFDYPQTKKRVFTRAEWDFTKNWTASVAYGQLDMRDGDYIYCGSTIVSASGDVSYDGDCYRGGTQSDHKSVDARVSGQFQTGAATHRLSVGATRGSETDAGPFVLFDVPGQTGSNIYNPTRYPVPAIPDAPYRGKYYEEVSRTVYVGDEIGLFDDRLLITVGARRIEFEFGDFDEVTGARLAPPTTKAATSPALGVVYKLSPSLMVYGNYAGALEQGSTAPDDASVDNPGQVLSPQKSTQRELGAKFDAGHYAVTAAVFQIEKANAVTVDRRFDYFGRQQNTGLELSLFGEPLAGLRVLSGVTYLKTRQRNTQVAETEGKSAVGAPKLQAQLGLEKDVFNVLPGLTLTGGVAYNGKAFVDNTNSRSIPSWTRVDAGLRYGTRLSGLPTTLRLNIENLADRDYWGSVDRGFLYSAQPRTVSFSATVDF